MGWRVQEFVGGGLLATIFAASALCGCAPNPDRYDCVSAVAREFNLGDLGEVVHEADFGDGGLNSDEPTREIVVAGTNAQAAGTTSLEPAGFNRVGDNWTREEGSSQTIVRLLDLSPGESLRLADGSHLPIKVGSLRVSITCYGDR